MLNGLYLFLKGGITVFKVVDKRIYEGILETNLYFSVTFRVFCYNAFVQHIREDAAERGSCCA